MEHKLFYQDSYIREFSTKGIRQEQDEKGNWYITLAETAFYPTRGGQPHDTGTLNNMQVVNVEEIEGEVRHYVDKPIENTEEIFGIINWERRFDHMQQHAGQHILTASFVELFGVKTVSFHLGEGTSTIDLHCESLTEQMALEAEKRANEIVLENRSIEAKWVTKEEANLYPLRKELAVKENIRLVIIPDFDYNGCGGTHPNSTGQVGSIKIFNWEKQKQNTIRVQFVCGNRVIHQLHKKQKILQELTPLLSVPEGEMKQAATRLLENEKELKKTVEVLRESLLHYEGKEILNSSIQVNGNKVVAKAFENRMIKELQKLARIMVTKDESANVFLAAKNGHQLQFVCTRGASAHINMKSIVQEILPLVKGKGGGNESTAQGGGESLLSGEELLKKIIDIVK